jgi:hypothetical protein
MVALALLRQEEAQVCTNPTSCTANAPDDPTTINLETPLHNRAWQQKGCIVALFKARLLRVQPYWLHLHAGLARLGTCVREPAAVQRRTALCAEDAAAGAA